jgi:hypothetical protein
MGNDKTRGQPEEISVLLPARRSESAAPLESRGIQPPQTPPEAAAQNSLAWEMIAAGRYMPRRIRGSFRGRELG